MGADSMCCASEPRALFQHQDSAFVAVVDGAFADAAKRSGSHLLCREGCSQCCVGVFAIGPADALRLREGLETLKQEDPERAARVRQRAATSWTRLAADYPGNLGSGLLQIREEGELSDAFENFGNDEPCPALDLEHGTCDLYTSRPQTCRLFGAPVSLEEGFGLCELCFQQATPQEIANAAISMPESDVSAAVDEAAIAAGQLSGSTVVAFILKS